MNLKHNKYIFTIFIFFSYLINNSLSLQNKATNKTRDFMTSYIKAFRGKDWVMDKDCLSVKFDDMSRELISDIKERNWIKFGFTLYSIIRLEMKECPFEDIEGIFKDLRISMKNGSSLTNTLKNYTYLELELKKYLDSDKSASSFGSFIGRITKIVVYGDVRVEEIPELKNNFNFLSK
jgi:hypothetical protein